MQHKTVEAQKTLRAAEQQNSATTEQQNSATTERQNNNGKRGSKTVNPYMAYEAVNTKIKTKKSNILDKKKLEKILDCDSVEQVAEFLKTKYEFKQIIDDAKSHDIRRDGVETLLKRYAVLEIESILHYFSGPYKEFLQVLLMEFEIADIVMLLRKVAKGEDMAGVENLFIHSENYSVLPYHKLMASNSVSNFIENLKNTPYYNFLKTITDNDVVKRKFHTEMELQILLYKTLIKKAEKLTTHDMRLANKIIGLKIDLLNVQWIYRARKYYNISPEEILIYSLRGGERVSFKRLKRLCYSKTIDEIQQLSNHYLRHRIFVANNEADIEKNIDYHIFDFVKDREQQVSIGTAISYIFMLEIVIKNLITVTEGIRYKLPKESLKQYLVSSK